MVSETTMTGLTIRTFQPSDLEAVLDLMNVCYRADAVLLHANTEMFMAQARRRGEEAERDYLVVEACRQMVAFSDLEREPGARLVSKLWIHPRWRSTLAGRTLVERRIEDASRFSERILDVPVRATQHDQSMLLESLGFQHVRTWWNMRVDLSGDLPAVAPPPGIAFRTAVGGQDDEMLTALMNDVFSDHWGEGEHSVGQIRQDLAAPFFDPQLLVFAETRGQPAGYVWSWIDPERRAPSDAACAYISDLGVKAAYRRRGLGRALLLRALADLQARGMRAAELEVDGPNADAKHLYESVGFQEHVELRWYRKQLAGR